MGKLENSNKILASLGLPEAHTNPEIFIYGLKAYRLNEETTITNFDAVKSPENRRDLVEEELYLVWSIRRKGDKKGVSYLYVSQELVKDRKILYKYVEDSMDTSFKKLFEGENDGST